MHTHIAPFPGSPGGESLVIKLAHLHTLVEVFLSNVYVLGSLA